MVLDRLQLLSLHLHRPNSAIYALKLSLFIIFTMYFYVHLFIYRYIHLSINIITRNNPRTVQNFNMGLNGKHCNNQTSFSSFRIKTLSYWNCCCICAYAQNVIPKMYVLRRWGNEQKFNLKLESVNGFRSNSTIIATILLLLYKRFFNYFT